MTRLVVALVMLAFLGCGTKSSPPPPPKIAKAVAMERLFPSDDQPGHTGFECMLASPVAWTENGNAMLLVAEGSGQVTALNPLTGAEAWHVTLPAPMGQKAFAVSTPVLLSPENLLVVAYHTTADVSQRRTVAFPRLLERMAVIDLTAQKISPDFPVLDLKSELPAIDGGTVSFRAGNTLARGALVHARADATELGRAYVTFGNVQDIQPWHGWIFEINLDRWKSDGTAAAMSAALVTTPESDCGPAGASGSRERICGGGLWSPSGPLLRTNPAADGGYELILPTGNGYLNLARGDYANTLMRTGRGLKFSAGCDEKICSATDPTEPNEACASTCKNLFVPRRLAGQPLPAPETGVCDGLTSFFACWAKLDFIGGSTPAEVTLSDGRQLMVYAPKDAYAYLVDSVQLGRMYDRQKLAEICGTKSDPCTANWAGMVVTQPAISYQDNAPVAVIPTFMYDRTHTAGVVALDVTTDSAGVPKLSTRWTVPATDSVEAKLWFRAHPSRPLVSKLPASKQDVVWVVDVNSSGGRLLTIRIADGALLAITPLLGPGMRFTKPLVDGNRIYVQSCDSDAGPSHVEGFSFTEVQETVE